MLSQALFERSSYAPVTVRRDKPRLSVRGLMLPSTGPSPIDRSPTMMLRKNPVSQTLDREQGGMSALPRPELGQQARLTLLKGQQPLLDRKGQVSRGKHVATHSTAAQNIEALCATYGVWALSRDCANVLKRVRMSSADAPRY